MFFNKYPYTDNHELNLDWIIAKVKELTNIMDEWTVLNRLTWRGIWNIGESYPQFSIVEDNHNGYVSIKPVPRNVEITNTDYWKLVADYSALYAAFSERITALENDAIIIHENLQNIEVDIANVEVDIETINGELENINKKITDNWLLISDSYGTDYANPTGDTRTIFSLMREYSGRSESELKSLAFSGCGFVNTAGGYTFLTGLQNRIGELGDLSKYSKIVVVAGRNDYIASQDSIEIAISQFISYVKSNFPNANCYLGFIGNGDNTSAGSKADQMNVFHAFKNCTKYGAFYLNGVENILKIWNAYMASDGIHPNIYGKIELAKYILNAIRTGSCSVGYGAKGFVFGLESGVTQSQVAPNTIFNFIGDNVTIEPTSLGTFNFNSAAGQYQVEKKIGHMTNESAIFNPRRAVRLPYTVDILNGSSKVASNGSLIVNTNGDLILYFYSPTAVTYNNIVCIGTGSNTYPSIDM